MGSTTTKNLAIWGAVTGMLAIVIPTLVYIFKPDGSSKHPKDSDNTAISEPSLPPSYDQIMEYSIVHYSSESDSSPSSERQFIQFIQVPNLRPIENPIGQDPDVSKPDCGDHIIVSEDGNKTPDASSNITPVPVCSPAKIGQNPDVSKPGCGDHIIVSEDGNKTPDASSNVTPVSVCSHAKVGQNEPDAVCELLKSVGYTCSTVIGRGGSGEVYRCINEDGKEVAVKVIRTYSERYKETIENINYLQGLISENKLNCEHLCIPKVKKNFPPDANNRRFLLLESEFLNKTDDINLDKLKKDRILEIAESLKESEIVAPDDTVDYNELKSCARQLLEGLVSLHKNKLVHGDFHSSNIFAHKDANGKIVYSIIDFDECHISEDPGSMIRNLSGLGRILFSRWYTSLQSYSWVTLGESYNLFYRCPYNGGDWNKMMLSGGKHYRIYKYIKMRDGRLCTLQEAYYDPNGDLHMYGEPSDKYSDVYLDEWYTKKDIVPGSEVDKFLKFVDKLGDKKFSSAEEALNDDYFKE